MLNYTHCVNRLNKIKALYLAYIKYRKNYIKKENVVLNLIIHIRKKKVIQKRESLFI